jgi:hypothetical protein
VITRKRLNWSQQLLRPSRRIVTEQAKSNHFFDIERTKIVAVLEYLTVGLDWGQKFINKYPQVAKSPGKRRGNITEVLLD